MTIRYERDADAAVLADKTVAVVGYGNQGRSWALNLRDSGIDPVVCVRADETRRQAEADGFTASELDAAAGADIACLLIPDDAIPGLPVDWSESTMLVVASGYTLAFDRIRPPGDAVHDRSPHAGLGGA